MVAHTVIKYDDREVPLVIAEEALRLASLHQTAVPGDISVDGSLTVGGKDIDQTLADQKAEIDANTNGLELQKQLIDEAGKAIDSMSQTVENSKQMAEDARTQAQKAQAATDALGKTVEQNKDYADAADAKIQKQMDETRAEVDANTNGLEAQKQISQQTQSALAQAQKDIQAHAQATEEAKQQADAAKTQAEKNAADILANKDYADKADQQLKGDLDALGERMDSLDSTGSQQQAIIDRINKDITQAQKDILANKDGVTAANKIAADAQSKADANKTLIDANKGEQEKADAAIRSDLDAIRGKVQANTDADTAIRQQIDATNTALSNAQKQIGAHEQAIAEAKKQASDAQAKADANAQTITANKGEQEKADQQLEADIAAANKRIDGIDTSQDSQQQTLDRINKDIAQAQKDILANKDGITAASKIASDAQAKAQANADAITANKGEQEKADAAIRATVDAQAKTIEANKAEAADATKAVQQAVDRTNATVAANKTAQEAVDKAQDAANKQVSDGLAQANRDILANKTATDKAVKDAQDAAQRAYDAAVGAQTTADGLHQIFKGPDDPRGDFPAPSRTYELDQLPASLTLAVGETVAVSDADDATAGDRDVLAVARATTVRQGDFWFKTAKYVTRWTGEADNSPSQLADFYTYWTGAADNSPSVLVPLDSRVTGIYQYDGSQWNEFNLVASNIIATGSIQAELVDGDFFHGRTIIGGTYETEQGNVTINDAGILFRDGSKNYLSFAKNAQGKWQLTLDAPLISDVSLTAPQITGGRIVGGVFQSTDFGQAGRPSWRLSDSGLEFWDGSGKTLAVDNAGNASFKGSITGSTITGSTIRTTNGRLVVNDTGLVLRDANGRATLTASTDGGVSLTGTLTGSTITGSSFTTANGKLVINDTGIVLKDANNHATVTMLASDGSVTLTGKGALTSGSTISGATITGGVLEGAEIHGKKADGTRYLTINPSGFDLGPGKLVYSTAQGTLTLGEGIRLQAPVITAGTFTGATYQSTTFGQANRFGWRLSDGGLEFWSNQGKQTVAITGDGGAVFSGTVQGSTIKGSSFATTNERLLINDTGIVLRDAAGKATLTALAADGSVTLSGKGSLTSGSTITGSTITGSRFTTLGNHVDISDDGMLFTDADGKAVLTWAPIKYYTRWTGEADNSPSQLADFYTYWTGEPNNSPSVLVPLADKWRLTMDAPIMSSADIKGSTITGGRIVGAEFEGRKPDGSQWMTINSSGMTLGDKLAYDSAKGELVIKGRLEGSTMVGIDFTSKNGHLKLNDTGLYLTDRNNHATVTMLSADGSVTLTGKGALTSGSTISGATITGGIIQGAEIRGLKSDGSRYLTINPAGFDLGPGKLVYRTADGTLSLGEGTKLQAPSITAGTFTGGQYKGGSFTSTTWGQSGKPSWRLFDGGLEFWNSSRRTFLVGSDGNAVFSGTIEGSTIKGSSFTTANGKMVANDSGLVLKDARNEATFTLKSADGSVAMNGPIVTGGAITGTTITGSSFQTLGRHVDISDDGLLFTDADGKAVLTWAPIKYVTRWTGEADNSPSQLADFYTYWTGEPNNSPSVLVPLADKWRLTMDAPILSSAEIKGSTLTGGVVKGAEIQGYRANNGSLFYKLNPSGWYMYGSDGKTQMVGYSASSNTLTVNKGRITSSTIEGGEIRTAVGHVLVNDSGIRMTGSDNRTVFAAATVGANVTFKDGKTRWLAAGSVGMVGDLYGGNISGVTITGSSFRTPDWPNNGLLVNASGLEFKWGGETRFVIANDSSHSIKDAQGNTVKLNGGDIGFKGGLWSQGTLKAPTITGGILKGGEIQGIRASDGKVFFKLNPSGLYITDNPNQDATKDNAVLAFTTSDNELTVRGTVRSSTIIGSTMQSAKWGTPNTASWRLNSTAFDWYGDDGGHNLAISSQGKLTAVDLTAKKRLRVLASDYFNKGTDIALDVSDQGSGAAINVASTTWWAWWQSPTFASGVTSYTDNNTFRSGVQIAFRGGCCCFQGAVKPPANAGSDYPAIKLTGGDASVGIIPNSRHYWGMGKRRSDGAIVPVNCWIPGNENYLHVNNADGGYTWVDLSPIVIAQGG